MAFHLISFLKQFLAALDSPWARRGLSGQVPRAVSSALVVVILAACSLPPPAVTTPRRPGEGTFVLFLNGPRKTPFSIAMDLNSMDAVRQDGTHHPILTRPRTIDSLNVMERQLLLSETFLPAGRYRDRAIALHRVKGAPQTCPVDAGMVRWRVRGSSKSPGRETSFTTALEEINLSGVCLIRTGFSSNR